ncbi:MAG TPA: fasciclin domain-containing protein [Ilumatobacteraceae bacterium]|nr:fasciclin domain-containing protein [Ilumatobacteraceae bacterium]
MRKSSTRLAGVAAIAGLVVLSACGSDSNDADEAVATTEAAPVATEGEDMTETTDDMADEPGTIVDVAVANGSFETLVAAVTAADLVDTLSSEGPFTVFAPTDDAFAALPEGLVDCLLLEENVDTLTAILTYHVVSGEVLSTDLTDGPVATVQTEEITVDLTDGVVLNETVNVIIPDVPASNGVIHAIDGVLLPPTVAAGLDDFVASCPA